MYGLKNVMWLGNMNIFSERRVLRKKKVWGLLRRTRSIPNPLFDIVKVKGFCCCNFFHFLIKHAYRRTSAKMP
jgi:hypothetical protein